MRKIVVHIGTHKTGTTFLQRFLSKNTALLAHHGIDIPPVGERFTPKSHHYIANYFRGIEDPHHAAVAEWLAQGVSTQPYCLISAESLYLCKSAKSLTMLRESFNDPCRIVCNFRSPESHFISMWKQYLKGKRKTDSLKSYLDRQTQDLAAEKSYYSYDTVLARWESYFSDVVYSEYTVQDNQTFIQSFFKKCGLPLPPLENLEIPKMENVSVSNECATLMLRFNSMAAEKSISMPKRDEYIKKILGNPAFFTEFLVPHAIWEDIDVTGLNTAFAKHNPRTSGFLSTQKTTISHVVDLELADADLENLMKRAEVSPV